ncbi:MAG: CRISPR-associated endonuclease Cas2 [Thermodesulfobacteriota bacterium]|nr:CRISPR-associated endonuclease Cas2 [Thermodesulfobacteriota bacterium]
MSMRNMERDILALYDICDPKRLSKVAKTLEGYGMRVQQSVFELNITPGKLKELHEEVNTIIDNSEDSVRYYILCKEDWQKRQSIGVSNFEEPDWDKKFFVV